MNPLEDPRFSNFVKGLVEPEIAQEPPGKDGDPQLAALRQYLQVLSSTLNSDDVILDVGSGRGVLADSMQKIWKDSPRLPWYYAVDLDELLYDLNLPREIHNHSRKILFSEFLNAQLPCNLKQVKVIVIRNTFHELNIKITAEVLIALRKITRFGAVVYLQDMENLPQGERENAGWHSKLLKPVLEQVGFECGVANREKSRSGIYWYTMILKDKHGVAIPSIAYAMNAISHGRTLQLNSDAKRLSEIKGSSKETLHEFVILATEVAALTVQLSTTQLASGVKNDMKEVGEVPLIGFSSTLDYAEETPTDLRKRSGLSGILSSKNLINLPVLIDRAVSRIWFAGYSQRLLFTIPEIRVALLNAAKRNVDIRILMVDPDSLAGQARSLSQAYASPDDFFNDVRLTVQQFALFKEELEKDKPMNPVTCDLRLSKCMLSASYFFVDDTCICSLYSSNLTGGVGGAFVFNSSSVQSNGYYQVLLREFQSDWGTDKE